MSKSVKQILIEATASKKRLNMFLGRFQPPTEEGHGMVIRHVLHEPGTPRIITTHSQDPKNPLTSDEKLDILKNAFPNHKRFFHATDKESPTIFHHLAKAHKEGFDEMHVYAGADRADEYRDKLNKYNGKFDAKGNGYHFKKGVHVHVICDTDPDAESGRAGISGSQMRSWAQTGDFENFHKHLLGGHNMSKTKVKEIFNKIKERIVPKKNISAKNEDLEIGVIVTDGNFIGEIIDFGPNYAVVVNEGEEHKIWLKNLYLTEGSIKRTQIFRESFIFKGYKTKHFSRELAEDFRDIAKTTDDEYALLSCIKAYDYILGVKQEDIVENFHQVKTQLNRAQKYSNKFSINIIEDKLKNIEKKCLSHAILEDLKFMTSDRVMIAKMIASLTGDIPNGGTPENIINSAISKIKNEQLNVQSWELIGRLFNVATAANIKWDKKLFSPALLGLMKLK